MGEKTIDFRAGFWLRLVSYIIDFAFLMVLTGGMNMALGLPFFSLTPTPSANQLLATGLSMLGGVLYFSIIQGHFSGTIGKKVLGLSLVDAKTFKKIGFGQSIGRYLMMIVSSACFCLGIIAIGWNKNKQGWHDRVCGTRVIKNKEFTQHRAHLKKKAALAAKVTAAAA
ncbi:MAG: RDD family protein [Bdellovibrionales bacterium]|nr:RDD family protein [Bdellovibrionales bacterium]